MYDEIKTREQEIEEIMKDVEAQKKVDDKVLTKPKRELTPEQKARQYEYERASHKRIYKDLHVTLNKNHHQDVIEYTEQSDKSPTQIYIDLVRKELNK